MAVEPKILRLAPTRVRFFHRPLPVRLQRQDAVRRVDQLRRETIGLKLDPFRLKDARIEGQFCFQPARTIGRQDRATGEARLRGFAPGRVHAGYFPVQLHFRWHQISEGLRPLNVKAAQPSLCPRRAGVGYLEFQFGMADIRTAQSAVELCDQQQLFQLAPRCVGDHRPLVETYRIIERGELTPVRVSRSPRFTAAAVREYIARKGGEAP